MKDDPELQVDDAWSEGRAYSPKRRGGGSGSSRYLRILVIVFLVLIFAGGILYFLGRQPGSSGVEPLQSKVIALEQRIVGLEKQIAELRGKISTPGPDLALLQRVDALSQKVEVLEKQKPDARRPFRQMDCREESSRRRAAGSPCRKPYRACADPVHSQSGLRRR